MPLAESIPVFAGALGALWAYMSLLFVIAVALKDNSIADIGYGMGVLVATTAAATLAAPGLAAQLLIGVVALWAIRLSGRIYAKNKGKPEDFRYRTWRSQWRHFYLRSYLQVFMLQGAVIYIVALPVLLGIVFGGNEPNTLLWIGLCAWIAGFIFEAAGDWQLDAFIRKPENKGRVMQYGLWRYTRHPNYFGESLMWWGIATASLGIVPLPYGFIGFLSPMLITFLLLKVSGIPLLEARFAGNPEWEAYRARTSAFIPLPPKRV